MKDVDALDVAWVRAQNSFGSFWEVLGSMSPSLRNDGDVTEVNTKLEKHAEA